MKFVRRNAFLPLLGFLLIALMIVASLGCPADPPDNPLDMVTLTGELDKGVDPVEGFLVIATDATTGFTYTTDVGADGTFALSVPKGKSCIYAVVDSEGKASNVFTFPGDRSKGALPSVPTGLKLEGDYDISTPVDVSENGATEVDVDSDKIDDAIETRLSGGEAPGFLGGELGKFGKGTGTLLGAGTTPDLGGKADPDGDGLPSVIDADDDGDGILDDWDKDADGDGVSDDSAPASSHPEVEFNLGFLLDIRGNDGVYSYDELSPTYDLDGALRRDMRVDFMVRFQDSDAFDSVQSIRLYLPSSPAYAEHLDAVEFGQISGGYETYTCANGHPVTPGEASMPWVDFSDGVDGYNIPESLGDTNTYRIAVKIPESPTETALFEVGDVFTIEIVYDDTSVEYVSIMLNYTYTLGTHYYGYAMAATTSPIATIGSYTPFAFDENIPNQIVYDDISDEYVHLAFIPPKDEDGNWIVPDASTGME